MKVFKVHMEGQWCALTHADDVREELAEIENWSPGESIRIEVAEMTQQEFDELPEFQGW